MCERVCERVMNEVWIFFTFIFFHKIICNSFLETNGKFVDRDVHSIIHSNLGRNGGGGFGFISIFHLVFRNIMGSCLGSCIDGKDHHQNKKHEWGQGHTLSSSSSSAQSYGSGDEKLNHTTNTNNDHLREKRVALLAAAEKRGNTNHSVKKKIKPKVQSNKVKNAKVSQSSGASKPLGTGRDAAAAAAEDRRKQDQRGLSDEKSKQLQERRIKDDLIGKIEHYYRKVGKEAPFGLPSASVSALKKQLAFAKNLAE